MSTTKNELVIGKDAGFTCALLEGRDFVRGKKNIDEVVFYQIPEVFAWHWRYEDVHTFPLRSRVSNLRTDAEYGMQMHLSAQATLNTDNINISISGNHCQQYRYSEIKQPNKIAQLGKRDYFLFCCYVNKTIIFKFEKLNHKSRTY